MKAVATAFYFKKDDDRKRREGNEANSKVHKEYETIFQQLLLSTDGPKNF